MIVLLFLHLQHESYVDYSELQGQFQQVFTAVGARYGHHARREKANKNDMIDPLQSVSCFQVYLFIFMEMSYIFLIGGKSSVCVWSAIHVAVVVAASVCCWRESSMLAVTKPSKSTPDKE